MDLCLGFLVALHFDESFKLAKPGLGSLRLYFIDGKVLLHVSFNLKRVLLVFLVQAKRMHDIQYCKVIIDGHVVESVS